MRNRKATTADFLIAGFLFLLVLAVVVPFINTIAISFSTQREYLNTPLLLIPRKPTLNNYINLLRDKRISIGYLTSLKILLLGLPILQTIGAVSGWISSMWILILSLLQWILPIGMSVCASGLTPAICPMLLMLSLNLVS